MTDPAALQEVLAAQEADAAAKQALMNAALTLLNNAAKDVAAAKSDYDAAVQFQQQAKREYDRCAVAFLQAQGNVSRTQRELREGVAGKYTEAQG